MDNKEAIASLDTCTKALKALLRDQKANIAQFSQLVSVEWY